VLAAFSRSAEARAGAGPGSGCLNIVGRCATGVEEVTGYDCKGEKRGGRRSLGRGEVRHDQPGHRWLVP